MRAVHSGSAHSGAGQIGGLLRWSWLLGVALMAPAALPAGGGDCRQPQLRRRSGSGPLHLNAESPLQVSPLAVAPTLHTLPVGTSLRFVRRWSGSDGRDWLQVQTLAGEQRRGWIRA